MTAPTRRQVLRESGRALAAGVIAPMLAGGTARARADAADGLVAVEPGAIPGAALFSAAFVDPMGRPASLERRAGRPMVVNFWASWCAPCRIEIPDLSALHRRDAGIGVVGLNIEKASAAVRDFVRVHAIDYPVLIVRDRPLELMRLVGNPKAGLPFTLIVDRDGAIVALRLGLLGGAQLDAAVGRLRR